jgi:hypothetical protein
MSTQPSASQTGAVQTESGAEREKQTISVNVAADVRMDGQIVGRLVAPVIHQQINDNIELAISIGETRTPLGVAQSSFRRVV